MCCSPRWTALPVTSSEASAKGHSDRQGLHALARTPGPPRQTAAGSVAGGFHVFLLGRYLHIGSINGVLTVCLGTGLGTGRLGRSEPSPLCPP